MPGNLADITVEVFLAWPSPNYVNPITRPQMTPYILFLTGITTLLVFMRIMLRSLKHGGGLGLDDALFIPSWVMLLGLIGTACYLDLHGVVGRHTWNVEPKNWVIGFQLGFIEIILFHMGECFLKVSILLFFRRMVKGTYDRRWQYATWIAIACTVIFSLVLCLALTFSCSPVRAYWMWADLYWAATNEFHCQNFEFYNLVAGIFTALSDLYSVLLPWAMVWHLQLPRRQKVGLYLVFSLGLVTTVIACIRTYAIHVWATTTDAGWYGYDALVWTCAEWNLATICACLPSLRALFRAYFNSRNARSRSGNSHSGNLQSQEDSRSRDTHQKRTSSTDSTLPFASQDGRYKAEIRASYTELPDPEIQGDIPLQSYQQAHRTSVYGTKRTEVRVDTAVVH